MTAGCLIGSLSFSKLDQAAPLEAVPRAVGARSAGCGEAAPTPVLAATANPVTSAPTSTPSPIDRAFRLFRVSAP